MSKTKAPSRIKIWLGVAAVSTLLLGAVTAWPGDDDDAFNRNADDQERERTAVFEATLTPDRWNNRTWGISWGISHTTKYEAQPDIPFKRTLTVKYGHQLRISVGRGQGGDAKLACSITVEDQKVQGTLYEGNAVCEAKLLVK